MYYIWKARDLKKLFYESVDSPKWKCEKNRMNSSQVFFIQRQEIRKVLKKSFTVAININILVIILLLKLWKMFLTIVWWTARGNKRQFEIVVFRSTNMDVSPKICKLKKRSELNADNVLQSHIWYVLLDLDGT